MEFKINKEATTIIFTWENNGIPIEKVVPITVNENGCFIPDRWDRTWLGFGKDWIPIKQMMRLDSECCCLNPQHEVWLTRPEKLAMRKEAIPANVKEEIKPIAFVPQKKESNRKLSDHDIAIICQSNKSVIVLAELFNVKRDTIYKVLKKYKK